MRKLLALKVVATTIGVLAGVVLLAFLVWLAITVTFHGWTPFVHSSSP